MRAENQYLGLRVRDIAIIFHDKLALGIIDAGLDAMKDIIEGIAGSADKLQLAIGAAEKGKSILSFPKLPSTKEIAQLQSLTPFAIALLAGYSVELLFAFFDKLIAAFTTK